MCANNKTINEMSFRSIRKKEENIVHLPPNLLYVFTGNIHGEKIQ